MCTFHHCVHVTIICVLTWCTGHRYMHVMIMHTAPLRPFHHCVLVTIICALTLCTRPHLRRPSFMHTSPLFKYHQYAHVTIIRILWACTGHHHAHATIMHTSPVSASPPVYKSRKIVLILCTKHATKPPSFQLVFLQCCYISTIAHLVLDVVAALAGNLATQHAIHHYMDDFIKPWLIYASWHQLIIMLTPVLAIKATSSFILL